MKKNYFQVKNRISYGLLKRRYQKMECKNPFLLGMRIFESGLTFLNWFLCADSESVFWILSSQISPQNVDGTFIYSLEWSAEKISKFEYYTLLKAKDMFLDFLISFLCRFWISPWNLNVSFLLCNGFLMNFLWLQKPFLRKQFAWREYNVLIWNQLKNELSSNFFFLNKYPNFKNALKFNFELETIYFHRKFHYFIYILHIHLKWKPFCSL